MKIGFDLDGVLCEINIGLLRIIDNLTGSAKTTAEEWYYRQRPTLLNPENYTTKEDEYYIITCRPRTYNDITIEWAEKYCPNAKNLFIIGKGTLDQNEPQKVIDWLNINAEEKAQTINLLKLEVFFEDSPTIVSKLRLLCPNTKTVCYGGRIE